MALNAEISDETAAAIAVIQHRLNQRFPGAIWSVPREALHISLIAWIDAMYDCGQDKNELFRQIEAAHTQTFTEVIENQSSITITFDNVAASPAAVIVTARDDGSFQNIRQQFVQRVNRLPGTKAPPTIVHSTICKFLKEIDLSDVQDFLAGESINIQQTVPEFRLVREDILYMIEYTTLKNFPLRGPGRS